LQARDVFLSTRLAVRLIFTLREIDARLCVG